MAVTFVGVRHHSPACARLVRETIERLRPAHVLVEGPADFTGRLDELLLGHEPPVAIFSYHRDGDRVGRCWTPFCGYSPEWIALHAGRAVGADVRFIDLPAWHPAFADRDNRYADAEKRYAEATGRLLREFAVDNTDILWDHLFEIGDEGGLAERLDAYFDLIRGEADAGADDAAREAYMARWIRAAEAAADGRPVVVVTGGFHTPALRALAATPGPDGDEAGRTSRNRRTGRTAAASSSRTRSGGSTRSPATSRACRRRSTTSGSGPTARTARPPRSSSPS